MSVMTGVTTDSEDEQCIIIEHQVLSVKEAAQRGLITYSGITYISGKTRYQGIQPTKKDNPWKLLNY